MENIINATAEFTILSLTILGAVVVFYSLYRSIRDYIKQETLK